MRNLLYITATISIFLIASLFVWHSTETSAQGSVNQILGYAWSSNIGWISFNCLNTDTCDPNVSTYAVEIAGNGDLSGYAWNDNIGWISFNEGELSGCPSGTCRAKLTGNHLTGWARAVSPVGAASSESGGWDGWISLDGDDYGVDYDNGSEEFTGWMWGSEVVGWITPYDMRADLDIPSVSLFSDPDATEEGGDVVLRWSSTGAASCVASDGWSGDKAVEGEEIVRDITEDTTYTITCESAVGFEDSDSADVEILTEATEIPHFNLDGPATLSMIVELNESRREPIILESFSGFEGTATLESELIDSAPTISIVHPEELTYPDDSSGEIYVTTSEDLEPGHYRMKLTARSYIDELNDGEGGWYSDTLYITIVARIGQLHYEEF